MNIQDENLSAAGSADLGQASETGVGQADHSATEKLRVKAHESVDKIAESSAAAERELRRAVRSAGENVRESEQRAKESMDQLAHSVSRYITRNPLMSAGIAFVAGIAVSKVLRS